MPVKTGHKHSEADQRNFESKENQSGEDNLLRLLETTDFSSEASRKCISCIQKTHRARESIPSRKSLMMWLPNQLIQQDSLQMINIAGNAPQIERLKSLTVQTPCYIEEEIRTSLNPARYVAYVSVQHV